MNWKCLLGLHEWHKSRLPYGMRIQCYSQKECERCGRLASGYAEKNHPFFRSVLGTYDDDTPPTVEGMENVTRVEIIDETGRAYVRYEVEVELSLQDNDRTLKVFVMPKK